jgi:hypothetical protein
MNDVHQIVMKRFLGSRPPILDVTPISTHDILFVYRSQRGMYDYLYGMINGVSQYFQEKIEVAVLAEKEGELHLKLTFEKEIQYTKKFRLAASIHRCFEERDHEDSLSQYDRRYPGIILPGSE